MKRLIVLTLAFYVLGMAGEARSEVVYHNSVGLGPDEYARFVAEPRGRGPHTVRVRDGRSGETLTRTVSNSKPRAYGRFVGIGIRIRFNARIRIRVANGSDKGRRVFVRVYR